jgi:hypothetical protein
MRDRSHELDLRWVGLAHSYRRMKLLARRGDGNVVFPRDVSAWFILVGLLISSLTSSSVLAQSHGDSREATADAGSISMATPTVVLLSRLVQSSDAKQIDAEAMTPYSQRIEGTDVVFEMVPIPGGEFLMGSPDSEPGRNADEGPQHRVRLEPFWMGKYEVTWGEFDLWAKTNRKDQKADSSDAALSANELIDAISRPTEPLLRFDFWDGPKGVSGYLHDSTGRQMLLQMVVRKNRALLSVTNRSGMGICLPSRHNHGLLLRRRPRSAR